MSIRVLYIRREPNNARPGLVRKLSCFLSEPLLGQDGFFEAALYSAFPRARVIDFEEFIQKKDTLSGTCDWLVFNKKSVGVAILRELVADRWFAELSCKKAFVVNNAEEWELPEEEVLDRFDVIFKRELLQDIGRYGVSKRVQEKLYTTMISCPLWTVHRRFGRYLDVRTPVMPTSRTQQKYDISFVGADRSDRNQVRRDSLLAASGCGLTFAGGLYQFKAKQEPSNWHGPSCPIMNGSDYLELVAATKVNLALDGIGGFTYRHLELWCLGAFMLSSPAIRAVTLPCDHQPVEGVHYVAFDGNQDLVEKAQYYASHDEEREAIAAAGRDYFNRLYDFHFHGTQIQNTFEKYNVVVTQ